MAFNDTLPAGSHAEDAPPPSTTGAPVSKANSPSSGSRSKQAAAGNANGNGRKRKFTVEERKGHSVVEKRRRENLNQKLLILARNLPTLSDKSSKRLSKNLIIQAAIDHVLAERALLLDALPQLHDLLEEHDELHKENDSWRIRAGLQPHPRDRKDEAFIRELFVVESYTYAAFPNGFAMVDKEDADEDEVPPPPAVAAVSTAARAKSIPGGAATPISPTGSHALPPLRPTPVYPSYHQPTPYPIDNVEYPEGESSSSLPLPAPIPHAPAPALFDDSAFVMNNFHYLGQHHHSQLAPPSPHSPVHPQPQYPSSSRSSLSNPDFYQPSISGHVSAIPNMPPATDLPLPHDPFGVTNSLEAEAHPHHNAVGVGTVAHAQHAAFPTYPSGFDNPVDFSQFPASSSNLDFLLHWPTTGQPGDPGGPR